jgi:hypothetical protein
VHEYESDSALQSLGDGQSWRELATWAESQGISWSKWTVGEIDGAGGLRKCVCVHVCVCVCVQFVHMYGFLSLSICVREIHAHMYVCV